MKPKEVISKNKPKIIKALEHGATIPQIFKHLKEDTSNFYKYYWKTDPDYKIAIEKNKTIISNIFN